MSMYLYVGNIQKNFIKLNKCAGLSFAFIFIFHHHHPTFRVKEIAPSFPV